MSRPKRVGVWCAVSSRPQASEEKDSLPAQRRAGEQFAAAIGGEVVAYYEVPGHTRDYWSWYEAESEMAAYRQVRGDLEAGRLDVVHCLDVDRLGRDPALIHQFYSLAERHNCEVYDASMPHVLGQQSMGHRYGMSVKSVAAGEDQRRRTARQRMGMKRRVKNGLHSGNWPLGYEVTRDESGQATGAEFDDMIGAVQLVTKLFLQGRNYGEIARVMGSSVWELPEGSTWNENRVRRAMLNDTYAGYPAWGTATAEAKSDKYPALWDDETYAAILQERRRRTHLYTHPLAGPLSGAVVCHRCGGSLGRAKMRHRDAYYLRCTHHAFRNRRPWLDWECHPNYIPEEEVMEALAQWLAQLAEPGMVDAVLAQNEGATELENEIAHLEAKLDGLEPKRRRLAHALADGKMTAAMYHEIDRELQDEQDAAKARLTELRIVFEARPDPAQRRRYVERLLAQGLDLRKIKPDVLRSSLRQAGIKIYVEEGKVLFCAFSG